MQDRKWFTPREGVQVVDPFTRQAVPARGKWVKATDEYFVRRVIDGDGELADQAPHGADDEE